MAGLSGVSASAASVVQFLDRSLGDGKLTNGHVVKSLWGWNGIAIITAISALALAKLAVDVPTPSGAKLEGSLGEDRRARYWMQLVSSLAFVFVGIFAAQRHLPNVFGIKA